MNTILAIIIACEIGFWIFVVLGLVARYILRRRRTGAVLLAMTPVVDLVLLTAVILNLQAGGTASFVHGLAALYLGVSIAYGHKMISWADARFAHRFGHAPVPVKRYGWDYTKECWKDVLRTATAVGIAAGVLWLLILFVDDPSRTVAMVGILPILGIWFGIDLIWAICYTVSPKKPVDKRRRGARHESAPSWQPTLEDSRRNSAATASSTPMPAETIDAADLRRPWSA